MPYTPRTWANGKQGNTPINATSLNNLEGAVAQAVAAGDLITAGIDTTDSAVAAAVSTAGTATRAALAGHTGIVYDTDHASVGVALAATPTGGTLEVRSVHTLSAPFVVDKACTVRFTRGGQITSTSTTTPILSVTASDVTLDSPRLVGPGSASTSTAGDGISAVGTVSAPITGLRVRRPYIRAVTRVAVHLEHVHRFRVEDCDIATVGYGGMLLLSCVDGTVQGGTIRDVVQPTGYPQSYGVAVTRWSASSLAVAPRSRNITVDNVTIDGVTKWEALDTHGGQSITFSNNTILNSYIGIACVPCPDTTGVNTYAPLDIVVIGNRVDAVRTDGLAGAGIQLVGAGSVGATLERATGVIVGNTVIRHGLENVSAGGGIFLQSTRGAVVTGNTVTAPGCSGVHLFHSNDQFSIVGNTVIDAWTNTLAFCADYYLRSQDNVGVVIGNTVARGSKTATLVNQRGFFNGQSLNDYTLSGNQFDLATTPLVDTGFVSKDRNRASKISFYGAVPVAKAASPGTATGTDAAVINALTTALRNLGLVT